MSYKQTLDVAHFCAFAPCARGVLSLSEALDLTTGRLAPTGSNGPAGRTAARSLYNLRAWARCAAVAGLGVLAEGVRPCAWLLSNVLNVFQDMPGVVWMRVQVELSHEW